MKAITRQLKVCQGCQWLQDNQWMLVRRNSVPRYSCLLSTIAYYTMEEFLRMEPSKLCPRYMEQVVLNQYLTENDGTGGTDSRNQENDNGELQNRVEV